MFLPTRVSALAAVLIALPAIAADEPPLRFAWPVPSQARINEKVEKKGRTVALRYEASLVPAGDRLELRLSQVQVVQSPLAGLPPARGLADSLLDTLLPTLVISRAGTLEDVVGHERAIEAALALAKGSLDDAEALKKTEAFLRAPDIAAALKRKSGEFWELWVGLWAEAEMQPGDDFTADVPLPLPGGTTVKQRSRLRHLGPHPETKGHVRLSFEGTLEGPEFTAAMSRFIGGLLKDAEVKDARPEDMLQSMRRDTLLSVVTEAATLRPREARSELTTTIVLKNGEKQVDVVRREYTFEWQDQPPAKK